MSTRLTLPNGGDVLIDDVLPQVVPPREGRHRVAVLTQPGATYVADRVVGRIDVAADVRVLPDRDDAKTPEVLADVWAWFADIGLGRGDTVVGVGGGAVTDLAGFAAATWMRGVEVVHVPTTLLGAVDAAIGGKTGINVAGKNLVGSFWQPARVAVDMSVLETLPADLRREGMAEALKVGYLADAELQAMVARDGLGAPLRAVVERAVAVKVAVVAEDEREAGRRAILNYGHTIGHAVERLSGLSHGESVAVGLVAAAAVGARRTGFDPTNEHRSTLELVGLPITVAGIDPDEALALVGLDKKRTAEGIRMVLLEGYQRPIVEVVDPEDVRAGLAAVLA